MDSPAMMIYIAFALVSNVLSYGFDSGTDQGACGKPVRASRTMHKPPCDLAKETYCISAGKEYPWYAVRRFIRENQGLMRRMYGDERHLTVLKAELHNGVDKEDELYDDYKPAPSILNPPIERNEDLYQNGDINTRYAKQEHLIFDDNELFDEARYIQPNQERKEDIILNTKFVYSQQPGIQIKLKEVLHGGVPKFTQKQTTPLISNKEDAETTQQTKMADKSQTNEDIVQLTVNSTTEGESIPENRTTYEQSSIASEQLREEIGSAINRPSTEENASVTGEELKFLASSTHATSMPTTPTPSSNQSSSSTSSEGIEFNRESETQGSTSEKAGLLQSSVDTEETTNEPNVETQVPIDQKRPMGEMLFQDFQENNNRPAAPHKEFNYSNKLRGVNACPVKEEVVAPFWANNTRGEVLALLNLYPFEQYVHWEKCTFEHRQMYCREGCRCEQQYRLHRLLAYDPNNECRGIFSDWFRFPSCCVCKCYDMPVEFRVTSRSPRSQKDAMGQKGDVKWEHEKPNTWFTKKKFNMKRFH